MTEPTQMSLPDQARLAADILDALNTRLECPTNGHWRPSELRGEADHIEAEERAAAERADMVETLAVELLAAAQRGRENPKSWDMASDALKEATRASAAQLVEAGWHKGDPA